jgi:nucleoside-diphosphate-sugar epimerase
MLKEKISVLGCGWLGEQLASTLASTGYEVKVSTGSEERYHELKSKWRNIFRIRLQHHQVSGNVEDFLASDILIINITPNRKEPEKEQFASLLPFVEQSSIQKVVFISSTSVYPMLNRVVTEDEGIENAAHPLYLTEQLLLQNSNFKTTVVRMAGLIGGSRHPGRFFQKTKQIKNSKAPVNLIHRDDCIKIIQQVIIQNAWGQVFNGCADTHPTKDVFYTAAAQSLGIVPASCGLVQETSFKIVGNEKVKRCLDIELKYPDLMDLIQNQYWV